jgi:hypothetical protein
MTTLSDALPGWFRPRTEQEEVAAKADKPKAASTTGGEGDFEPVVVWEAANHLEAQIVKGRLESEGIPAIIRGEALGAIYGLTTGRLAATDVLTPALLAGKAIEILNTKVEWAEDDIDD